MTTLMIEERWRGESKMGKVEMKGMQKVTVGSGDINREEWSGRSELKALLQDRFLISRLYALSSTLTFSLLCYYNGEGGRVRRRKASSDIETYTQ